MLMTHDFQADAHHGKVTDGEQIVDGLLRAGCRLLIDPKGEFEVAGATNIFAYGSDSEVDNLRKLCLRLEYTMTIHEQFREILHLVRSRGFPTENGWIVLRR